MRKIYDYAVTVQPLAAEQGGGYLARVLDLPGCMSDGASPEEAFANAQDAITSWIEAAEELGRSIPAPTTAASEALHDR